MAYRFDHDRYLQHVPLTAPLRLRVRAYCEVCEGPVMPPAANGGIRTCPDCRMTPEYRDLVVGRA